MTQTRRLAAIMAVDVVGYSLMHEDGSRQRGQLASVGRSR
jgi:hypothetical protein